eukprot:sb/3470307/
MPDDREYICSEYAKSNFIQVKILEVIAEERDDLYRRLEIEGELEEVTATPSVEPTTVPMYRKSVRVSAQVVEVYRQDQDSDLSAGDVIELESRYDDASCGVGGWINRPGAILIINTDNIDNRTWMGLCDFIRNPEWLQDESWEQLEELLRGHDCSCNPKKCVASFGRRNFRGKCKHPGAFCKKNRNGKCRWRGPMESIDDCRYEGYWD